MDILKIDQLKDLLNAEQGWCVSLFMPTHRAGRETEQDRIRFRNLLRQAETRLLDKGLRTPDVQVLLKPANDLLIDPAFWRHQSDGLVIFLSEKTLRTFRLPLSFNELLVIAERFHYKPLLPLLTGDGHFYILALSQNQVRLLEGTRFTVDEIDLENMPTSMAEALQFERFEQHLQFHTRTPSGYGKRAAVFHGHDLDDELKGRIVRWFHKIDDELPPVLSDETSPVVMAGVDYLFPLFRQASALPRLVEGGIPGNPEALKPQELHAQAWPLVEPIFRKTQDEALTRYQQLSVTGQTSNEIAETLIAAQHGRIETLFVAIGEHIWGNFSAESGEVHLHEISEIGDEDLLDRAALLTLLNRGTVYAVNPQDVPGGALLAAIFRY